MASSSKGASTPIRNSTPTQNKNNNNYAAPHTPIASVKRPRSSLENAKQSTAATTTMSPMHPPRPPLPESIQEESSSWVGRQVDALFSPVLSFLGKAEEEEEVHTVTDADDDVAMEKESANTEVQVKESSSSTTVFEEEEEELHHDMQDLEETPSSSFDEEEFNPYLFIKSLPPYDSVKGEPRICLPPKSPQDSNKLTLVLDLDETLVHCTVDPTPNADLVFPVFFHGMEYSVHVRLRPFLQDFLEKVHQQYEVVVFTASQKVYANELLNRIDPEGKYIHHRLFRESCLPVEGNFLKDLNVLGRDLNKTVLVDNSPHAFGYQVDNGIPIESWFDDVNDKELVKLEKFLRTLQEVDNVRTVVKKEFQTYKKVALS